MDALCAAAVILVVVLVVIVMGLCAMTALDDREHGA